MIIFAYGLTIIVACMHCMDSDLAVGSGHCLERNILVAVLVVEGTEVAEGTEAVEGIEVVEDTVAAHIASRIVVRCAARCSVADHIAVVPYFHHSSVGAENLLR